MTSQQSEDQDGSPPLPFGPLPSGRHRFSPEQVAHHQRERLIAGLAAVVAERGYAAATIGEIAAAAHVSRRVFYEHFQTKEECFLAAFDVVFEHLGDLLVAAVAAHPGDWPQQVVSGLRAALGFFAERPDLARLFFLESPSAGPALQRRATEVGLLLAPHLRAGREQSRMRDMPDSTEPSLFGAVGSRIRNEVALRGSEGLTALLPEMVEFVLIPYLGGEEARRYAAEAEEDQP